jgi:transcriptional regulator with XRE-family HTH domain
MSDFGSELTRLMTERGTGVRQLARAVYCAPGHVSNLRNGKARPSPELARAIDGHLGGAGQLAALAEAGERRGAGDDDELAAIELARRAQVSDVGAGTCERLELVVDDFATAYPSVAPAELLPRVRKYVAYVTGLGGGGGAAG